MHKLRPLAIRVRGRHELPNGGISESQAHSFGRVSADAFVLLRVLLDENRLNLTVATVEGETQGPIAPSALFHLWVAFTGHVARTPLPEGDEQAARQIAFCRKVLLLMQLDENMGALASAVANAEADNEPTPSDPERPSSTQASPTAPPDGAPSSKG